MDDNESTAKHPIKLCLTDAMIPKPENDEDVPTSKKLLRKRSSIKKTAMTGKPYKRDYVMISFGQRDQEVIEALKKRAKELGWTHSTLAKEIIRKYLGFPTYF